MPAFWVVLITGGKKPFVVLDRCNKAAALGVMLTPTLPFNRV